MFSTIVTSAAAQGYLGIVLCIWAGTVGLPIPEEAPLVTAGVFAARGTLDLGLVLLVGIFACISGDLAVYVVGRRVGLHLEGHRYLKRVMRGRMVARARRLYVERGPWALFVARLLPGFKTTFIFTAGALRMPFRRFLAYDLASVFLLVPALVALGFVSPQSLEQLRELLHQLGLAGLVVAGGGIAFGVAALLVRRRRRQLRLVDLLTARRLRAAAAGAEDPPRAA